MAQHDEFDFRPEHFSGSVRLFPLPNVVMFPHVMQPLQIFEPRYLEMLADALAMLPQHERYLALEQRNSRYDVGVKYGLLNAQLALALDWNRKAIERDPQDHELVAELPGITESRQVMGQSCNTGSGGPEGRAKGLEIRAEVPSVDRRHHGAKPEVVGGLVEGRVDIIGAGLEGLHGQPVIGQRAQKPLGDGFEQHTGGNLLAATGLPDQQQRRRPRCLRELADLRQHLGDSGAAHHRLAAK